MNLRWSPLLSVISVGALTLGTILFLIVPTTGVIRSLHQAIEQEQIDAEERYFHRQKNRSTIAHMSEINTALPDLQRIMLPEGQELSLIEHIETLAATHQLDEHIRLLPPSAAAKNAVRTLQFVLTLSGDARALGAFLSDLETQDPLLLVTNMRVEQSEKPGIVNATLQGWLAWPESAQTPTL